MRKAIGDKMTKTENVNYLWFKGGLKGNIKHERCISGPDFGVMSGFLRAL